MTVAVVLLAVALAVVAATCGAVLVRNRRAGRRLREWSARASQVPDPAGSRVAGLEGLTAAAPLRAFSTWDLGDAVDALTDRLADLERAGALGSDLDTSDGYEPDWAKARGWVAERGYDADRAFDDNDRDSNYASSISLRLWLDDLAETYQEVTGTKVDLGDESFDDLYREALTLARSSPAGFEAEAVRQRIRVIESRPDAGRAPHGPPRETTAAGTAHVR